MFVFFYIIGLIEKTIVVLRWVGVVANGMILTKILMFPVEFDNFQSLTVQDEENSHRCTGCVTFFWDGAASVPRAKKRVTMLIKMKLVHTIEILQNESDATLLSTETSNPKFDMRSKLESRLTGIPPVFLPRF